MSIFRPRPQAKRRQRLVLLNRAAGRTWNKSVWTRNKIKPPSPPRPQPLQWSVGEANIWGICKVPHRLREVNKTAYEPNVISIGPYHYGKQHLSTMEVLKRSCFEESKLDFDRFREAVKPLEQGVRNCYGQAAFNLGSDDVRVPATRTGNENKKDIKHLLDLVHSSCSPSAQGIEQHRQFKQRQFKQERPNYQQRSCKFIPSAAELEEHGIKFHGVGEDDQDHSGKFKRGTRQQEDHGINLHDNVEADGSDDQGQLVGMFDIEFSESSKKLKIPTLPVDDDTECFFRNFMAYEQIIPSGEPTYVSDYVVLMDNLINTGKDVNLLCKTGIIDNWLGDEEAVAQMFNKLRDFINSPEDFYYAEIFDRLNRHCDRKWNKWLAALKKDYFKTPWSLVSFIAALVLLVLTLLQTIFSVLAYF